MIWGSMKPRTGADMSSKKLKPKREGPLPRIPLPFEEVISDVLKVKPESKPAKIQKRKGD